MQGFVEIGKKIYKNIMFVILVPVFAFACQHDFPFMVRNEFITVQR